MRHAKIECSKIILRNKEIFPKICTAYASLEKELSIDDRLPYKTTSKGCWATSTLCNVLRAFEELELNDYKNMVDLGSGDGRVVAIASLFTKATGIEIDPELHSWAVKIRDRLRLNNVSLHCSDYTNFSLSPFDFIYIYPDKPQLNLEKFLKEWRGTVMIAGPHFPPKIMKKRRVLEYLGERYILYGI